MISLGSRLIACCKLAPTLARQMWRHDYVIDRNEYLIFTLSESRNPWVYSLHFLFKSTNKSWRYERKYEWVFFFWTQCMVVSILGIIGWCIFGIQGIVQQRKSVKIIHVLTEYFYVLQCSCNCYEFSCIDRYIMWKLSFRWKNNSNCCFIFIYQKISYYMQYLTTNTQN